MKPTTVDLGLLPGILNPQGIIRAWQAELGRRGGRSVSEAKRAAGRINASKATAARIAAAEQRRIERTHNEAQPNV